MLYSAYYLPVFLSKTEVGLTLSPEADAICPTARGLQALPTGGRDSFQVYVFYIYPGAGEKSGIKLPLGKGIPLITEAKIFKKPLRKQLKNRVELF